MVLRLLHLSALSRSGEAASAASGAICHAHTFGGETVRSGSERTGAGLPLRVTMLPMEAKSKGEGVRLFYSTARWKAVGKEKLRIFLPYCTSRKKYSDTPGLD